MKAEDHLFAAGGPRRSLYWFLWNEDVCVAKLAHGARRTAALNGSESASGGIAGWGCRIWEKTPSARFPPAESPAIAIVEGLLPRSLIKCRTNSTACFSWAGYRA